MRLDIYVHFVDETRHDDGVKERDDVRERDVQTKGPEYVPWYVPPVPGDSPDFPHVTCSETVRPCTGHDSEKGGVQ